MASAAPNLTVITGNRADALAREMARVLADSPAPPLCLETVAVESPGAARWLSLTLADISGSASGLEVMQPNALLRELFSAVVPGAGEDNPFEPEALAWRVLGLLPSCASLPEFSPVAGYLADDPGGRKLWGLSVRIAQVFDRYALFRPRMVLSWERGEGEGWQAELFRRLCAEAPGLHRAALLKRLEHAVEQGDHQGLAARFYRIHAFGFGALPPFHLRALSAASAAVPVIVYHLNPCRHYWADVTPEKRIVRLSHKAGRPAEDLHLGQGNPLLASLGQAGRDFFSALAARELVDFDSGAWTVPEGDTVLSRVQADVLNLEDPTGSPRPMDPTDRSLTIHACHSPLREMEVLYDRILEVLRDNPDLGPQDVLVLLPDIDAYAPAVQAVFGVSEEGRPRLPFSIAGAGADPGPAQALWALLSVCRGRFSASSVADLLRHPSLGERFGVSETDFSTLFAWIRDAGICWGVDEEFKDGLGLPPTREHTWRAGEDRLLLGYAMKDSREPVHGVLPAAVDAQQGELLGRFLVFAEKVFSLAQNVRRDHTPGQWAKLLFQVLEDFFPPRGENAPDRDLVGAVSALSRAAERWGAEVPLSLAPIQEFLAGQMSGSRAGRGFLSSGVTFASLSQGRGLPFPAIFLAGMNEGEFPSTSRPPGFDLMAGDFRPGDRDRRMEDRYLFLETLLSAKRVLTISYVGVDPLDNSPVPPSAVVSELLDYLRESFVPPEKDRDPFLVTHRLHGFAPEYFSGDNPGMACFSPELLAAARARSGEAPEHPWARPLPPPEESWYALDVVRLCRFFENPAEFLAQRRLKVVFAKPEESLPDAEPFALGGLDGYRLHEHLAGRCLATGADPADLYGACRAGGFLPHGQVGAAAFDRAVRQVAPFLERVRAATREQPRTVSADLGLGPFRLHGGLGTVMGPRQVLYRPAKEPKAKDLIRCWVRHLALCAAGETVHTLFLSLTRDVQFAPLSAEDAGEELAALLSLYEQGLCSPLPFFPRSSLAFAKKVHKEESEAAAFSAARKAWDGGEGEDPYFSWCFGSDPLDGAFAEASCRVFLPMLAAQTEPEAP
ncbi:MAG: exodeoxyribonuclease V subunit gamma [Deltaproteobacteria bacterium]|nr:exodeoxyribonuclease V subunit gamma [Deltaproteobacteria bacterium]